MIANYQAVVPSTWNCSPRDKAGKRGPYEESLIGTKLAKVDQPLEILRTIHSFDPCMACAVHIIDPKSDSDPEVQGVLKGGCRGKDCTQKGMVRGHHGSTTGSWPFPSSS